MFSRTLAALAAAALLVSAAPAASASEKVPASAVASTAGQRWTVSPADADGPDGRISLRHTIDPGSAVSDAIAVTNLGTEPATYAVAPGDGVVGDDGAFDIAPGEPDDAGSWIRVEGLDAGTVAVDPGETRVLPVRIDVPAGVAPGDHPAGIVVGQTQAADGVSVTNRIGVRVHLQVAGDIVPALTVESVTASFTPSWIPFAPGALRVESAIVNSGNVRLGAATAISGLGVEASEADAPVELLPGDRVTIVAETTAWPVFLLGGTASVQPVVLGEDGIIAPDVVDDGFTVFAPSWTGLALLVLVAGAIVALIVRMRARRRADAEPPRPGAEHASVPGATPVDVRDDRSAEASVAEGRGDALAAARGPVGGGRHPARCRRGTARGCDGGRGGRDGCRGPRGRRAGQRRRSRTCEARPESDRRADVAGGTLCVTEPVGGTR